MAIKIGKVQKGFVPRDKRRPATKSDANNKMGCYISNAGKDGKINDDISAVEKKEFPVEPGMVISVKSITLGRDGDDLYVIEERDLEHGRKSDNEQK